MSASVWELTELIADMLSEHAPTWGCDDPNHTTRDVAAAIAAEVVAFPYGPAT